MCRLGWCVPLLFAGCSTAPMAGLMDSIDKHHYQKNRDDRDDPRLPPPGYEPVGRTKTREPVTALPASHTEPADDLPPASKPAPPKPKAFDPAKKVRQTPPGDPASRVESQDRPAAPPAPKPKAFDPAKKVRPSPESSSADPPPAQPASLPPPKPPARRSPPASDERDDF